MVLFQPENSILSKESEGVQHFPGMINQPFSRGVQMLISIETDMTCDFLGGGGGGPGPYSPSVFTHELH